MVDQRSGAAGELAPSIFTLIWTMPMRMTSLAALVALAALPGIAFAQTAAPAASTAPVGANSAAPVGANSTAPVGAGPAAKSDMSQDPEAKARFEKFRAVCGADLDKHCGTVERGTEQARGQMRQCITTHKASFSASCQAAIVERDAAREARKQDKPKT